MVNVSLSLSLWKRKETNKTPQFRLLLLLFSAASASAAFFPLFLSPLSLLLVQLGERQVGPDVERQVEQEEDSHDLVFESCGKRKKKRGEFFFLAFFSSFVLSLVDLSLSEN